MKKILSLILSVTACVMVYADYSVPSYKELDRDQKSDFTVVKVKYASVGADGKTPAMVSGIVTFPNSKKAEAILMDNHFTITKDADAPSNKTPELITNDLFSMGAYYCFTSADYLGYGYTADRPHTYLCQQQNALNSIDLMKVARAIYQQEGVEIKNDVFVNTGYSQGGGVTMAVHREMERNKELAKDLHFAGSFCGAGPYDLEATMLWYMEQNKLSEPSLMPLVIKGLITGGFLPSYQFKDFFRFDTQELEEAIDGKKKSLSDLSKMMLSKTGGKSSAQDILSSNLLNSNSKMYADFLEAARKNSLLDDWTPTFPLHVYHLQNDSVVPSINADNAIAAFNLDEEYYQIAPASMKSNHSDFAIYFYRYIYLGKLDDMIETAMNAQGIESVINAPMDGIRYNILGMPVDENYHGIIILNGKKMLQ